MSEQPSPSSLAGLSFSPDEIRHLQPGEPKPVEPTASPRGAPLQEFLRWLQSDNRYLNPVTGQTFNVEIVTSDPDEQAVWQQHLRIAARVEPSLTAATSAATAAPSALASVTLNAKQSAYTQVDTVHICLTVADSGQIQPPYKVVFLIDPSEIAGATTPTEPTSATPRNSIEATPHTIAAGQKHFTKIFPCRTIEVTVQAMTSAIKANLAWTGGGSPALGQFRPIQQGAEHTFVGNTNNNQPDDFMLSVASPSWTQFMTYGAYE